MMPFQGGPCLGIRGVGEGALDLELQCLDPVAGLLEHPEDEIQAAEPVLGSQLPEKSPRVHLLIPEDLLVELFSVDRVNPAARDQEEDSCSEQSKPISHGLAPVWRGGAAGEP